MLALWQAFFAVEPWGQEYERHAVTASLLSAIKAQIAATAGVRDKVIPFAEFMPGSWSDHQQVKVDSASLKAAEQAFAKRWG